jgi:phosphoribosylaminoimidazole carboxylase (NCAIR synthetase)
MAGSQDLTAQDFPSQKLVTSQFENHLEPFDLPLGNTDSKVAGIMVNLVGLEDILVTLFTKTSKKNIRLEWGYPIFT